MSAPAAVRPRRVAPGPAPRGGVRPGTVAAHAFLVAISVAWVFPLLWGLFNSFRDYAYTTTHGYASFGGFTLDNFSRAWTQGDMARYFLNSVYITVPSVLLALLLASSVGFVLARFSFKLNLALLGLFTAANLLPQQALLIPLYRLFRAVELPIWLSDSPSLLNTHFAVVAVNVAFQTGFCTFVLSNYMKTLPHELYEAAQVDGLSIWRQYWQITMPLCRPALAALGVLEVTWIYNEFFWATVLLQSGDKFPMTSALNNLKGEFFTDYNLLSAGSMLVAIPTLVVFFALQKQFVSGLTLGATKG
ncbi:carbohydrate ABC transporter permease [Kineococcus glutinatus]|uniref:Carbohydrate ABC transporter permease n=1 Tax=Kineococcus glutinatus TaxID=1070872 RepID=A0ABP8VGM4_9ACTN